MDLTKVEQLRTVRWHIEVQKKDIITDDMLVTRACLQTDKQKNRVCEFYMYF